MQSTSSLTNWLSWRAADTGLRSIGKIWNGVTAFVTLLFDESGNLEPVWTLSSSLVDSSAFEWAIASMKTRPEIANFLSERYVAPAHSVELLSQCPEGSLGYVYAQQMTQLGLQPIQPAIAVDCDRHYVEYRWQQTHDIWHVITGFDTSGVGEIGLQAFYLAQVHLPLSSLLIANALISTTLLQPESLNLLLSAIAQGWQMGKNAKPLIAQKWEEGWEKSLVEWQRELNVYPVNP